MTLASSSCFVCDKPIVSADGAAKVGDHLVHVGCASIAIAKRALAKAQKKTASAATPAERRGLVGRLLRRLKVRGRADEGRSV